MKTFQGLIIIFFIRLLGWLPLAQAQRIGQWLGSLFWRMGGTAGRIAQVNLELCYPTLSADERQQMQRAVFRQSAMTLTEMGLMWSRSPATAMKHIVAVKNRELLDAALQQGKGVLLLAPHLGNWELANTYMAAHLPLVAMYRPARTPLFDRWMHERREQTGATLVPTNVSGVKALYRTLKAGGVVGFLPDQEPSRESGDFAPFMGVPALTPTLPHQLLKRTGAQALFIFARRLADGRGFEMHFMAPPADIYAADQTLALTALNQGVEQCVAQCPQQYQWLYRRFKCQPDGRSGFYRRH